MDDIMSKECKFCGDIRMRTVEDDFSKWFTYRYKEHKNSTDEKSISICPHCINIIAIVCGSVLDYRESQKDVASTQ